MKRGWRLLALVTALLLTSQPAVAKFGITKTHATFLMRHPPAFYTPRGELQIQVTSIDPRGGPMLAPRIEQLLKQHLVRENFRIAPSAPTLLQVTVNEAVASLERQTRSESKSVHVGYHTEYDKKGNAKQVEDCKWQQVDLVYSVSSGALLLDVMATDVKTQTTLLTRPIRSEYHEESAVGGPTLCRGQGYGMKPTQLQRPLAILNQLVDQALIEAVKLVAGYSEPRRVMLAVDSELKPGNVPALSGNWQQALQTWGSASVRKSETEAARQYNQGVAHEALAAAAMTDAKLDEAKAHLDEAEKCYKQALALDPGERYFRDTLPRLQGDRDVLQRVVEQESLRQAEAAAPPPTPSTAHATAMLDVPLEGWPEGEPGAAHDFRVYVRGRIATQKEEPNEAFRNKLVADATDYGVREAVAIQVVDSEVKRKVTLVQQREKYRELFEELAVDGNISAEEQEILRKRQQTLRLPDEEVRPAVSFAADSHSVERGQATTLRWSSVYATYAEISPDLGRVAASGTRTVTPTETTTYQLNAHGPDGTASASLQIQVTVPRLTEDNVLDLLKNDVPRSRIASLAAERGVAFDPTPAVEQRLRAAGADDALMEALRKARR